MKKIAEYPKKLANYIYQLSMLQTVVAFTAGGSVFYYLLGTLEGFVDNETENYLISTAAGIFVGLATVYGAERDTKNIVSKLSIEVDDLEQQCHKFQIDYLKMKGKHAVYDNLQVSEKFLEKTFSRLEAITTENATVEIKKTPSVIADTRLRGSSFSDSSDEMEVSISIMIKNKLAQDASLDLGFWQKFRLFFKESSLATKATVLTNLAMISYYLGTALEDTELTSTAIWTISISLGMITSPVVTYLTAGAVRDERIQLENKRNALTHIRNDIETKYLGKKAHLETLQELSLSNEYHSIHQSFGDSSQTTNLKSLSVVFKKINENIETRKHKLQDPALTKNDLTMEEKPDLSLTTPLLSINNSDSENPDEPSTSSFCLIL
jgi:hypothetical protein